MLACLCNDYDMLACLCNDYDISACLCHNYDMLVCLCNVLFDFYEVIGQTVTLFLTRSDKTLSKKGQKCIIKYITFTVTRSNDKSRFFLSTISIKICTFCNCAYYVIYSCTAEHKSEHKQT